MKRILTFVMVLLCLMCGCQRQYSACDIKPQTTEIFTPAVTQATAAQASPPANQTTYIKHLPEDQRIYYEPQGNLRMMSGMGLTRQELKMLSVTLRIKQWEKLSTILEAFGIRLRDAEFGNTDILLSELERDEDVYTKYTIDFPDYRMNDTIAYIRIRPEGARSGMEYLLVFKKDQNALYAPTGIISYGADYYEIGPQLEFEKTGGRTFLVWTGLTDHGTACLIYTRRWYDIESGEIMLSFVTNGNDLTSGVLRDGGVESCHWSTSVSQEASCFGDSWDFYVNADTSICFTRADGDEERYQCLYRVYYDADKYMFYSPIDALTPIYEQASKSNTKGVADWANEAMQKINYPMQSDGR